VSANRRPDRLSGEHGDCYCRFAWIDAIGFRRPREGRSGRTRQGAAWSWERGRKVYAARGRWANTAISWRLKQIRQRADVPADLTLYAARPSFITQKVLSGADIGTVAELAGHARISTTEHYMHIAGRVDHVQRAVAGILFAE
jgi:integrase